MSYHFFHFGPLPSNAITHSYYDYSLVILSYVIAVFASYVALDMAGRLRAEQNKRARLYWLIGGAIAMGAGIWAMHFIGMLAFIMPIPISYNIFWTSSSMLLAILASGFALFLLRKEHRPAVYLAMGGILLGFGIAAMHYTGMAGMIPVSIHYLPHLFFLSIVIAILASEAALWFALQSNQGSFKRQINFKILSALIMGAAICGMHYIGMAAAIFTPIENVAAWHGIQYAGLEFYVAGITVVIMTIALITSMHKQLVVSVVQNEKKFLNTVLDNLEDGIVACNAKGKITVLNHALKKMLNFSVSEDNSKNWTDYCRFYHLENRFPLSDSEMPLFLALNGKYVENKELILKTKNGSELSVVVNGQPIINTNKEITGAVIAIHDVTERKQMEGQLIRQATHDLLTDLPNRTLLIDRLEQAIHLAKRSDTLIAVLFIDVDRFKLVNDNFGHTVGDELLLIISKRLQHCIRESDTVARLSGDEFVVVLTNLEDEEAAFVLAQRILTQLSQPFHLLKVSHAQAKQCTKITASIGISTYPRNGNDPDTLLKDADTAMYQVKALGRNNIKFFSDEMKLRTIKYLELEQYLLTALENQQFVLYYQPILDLHSGYIVGFEALLRWQHPTLGLLLPMDFIQLVEETGQVIAIGEWSIQTACAQTKTWHDQGLPNVRVAVNISSRQITESDLYATVKNVLNNTQLDPKYLELELTESIILEYPAKSLIALTNIRELGVHIALDDFGTGYSNLGYLSRLPVSKLKIDQSFVHNITERSENAAIVLAIINLASSMQLKVTAEGLETRSELAFFRFNRCDEVQGYYFSRPLTAEDATKLLKENPQFVEVHGDPADLQSQMTSSNDLSA